MTGTSTPKALAIRARTDAQTFSSGPAAVTMMLPLCPMVITSLNPAPSSWVTSSAMGTRLILPTLMPRGMTSQRIMPAPACRWKCPQGAESHPWR